MKVVQIIFAIMLFVCLSDMPYGYYQLVRTIGMVFFGYLALDSLQTGNSTKAIICIGLVILFQPIIKISLGRELWNMVDVVIGIGLLIDAFASQNNTKK